MLREIKKGKNWIEYKRTFSRPDASNNLLTILEREGMNYKIDPEDSNASTYPTYQYDENTTSFLLRKGKIYAENSSDKKCKMIFEIKPDKTDRRSIDICGYCNPDYGTVVEEILTGVYSDSQIHSLISDEEEIGKVPNIQKYSWNAIGGLDGIKEEFKKYIEWPLKNYKIFEEWGVTAPKGVILYGPPGTGKTLLAKIIASEADAYFLNVSAADLTTKWYGESEKNVNKLFKQARENTPSIIFIDEIDGLFLSRDNHLDESTRRVLGQFLVELDGLEELKGTVVLGATNKLEDIDPAVIRPGRFGKLIEIPLPNEKGRKDIFNIYTKKFPLEDVNIDELARYTEDCSGADIESICQQVAYKALEDYTALKKIRIDDIKGESAKKIKINRKHFLEVFKYRKS